MHFSNNESIHYGWALKNLILLSLFLVTVLENLDLVCGFLFKQFYNHSRWTSSCIAEDSRAAGSPDCSIPAQLLVPLNAIQ